MSSPGSKVYEAEISKSYDCICGKGECAALSKCFRSIGDARGGYVQCPVIGKRGAALKTHKMKRACVHLGFPASSYDQYASVDNRTQAAATPATSAKKRAKKKDQEKERPRRFISLVHFHPLIIPFMIGDDRSLSFADFIPEGVVKDLGLINNGYTDADLLKKDGKPVEHTVRTGSVMTKVGRIFPPTPSYSINNAVDDYEMAKARYNLNQTIESCRNQTYGQTYLRPRGVDEVPTPVTKLARRSPPTHDDCLRAVCLLSERVDELSKENEQLKERAMQAEERANDVTIACKFMSEMNGGLTRFTITSDEHHKKNPNIARIYFRFEDSSKSSTLSSWDLTKNFARIMFGIKPEPVAIEDIERADRVPKRLNEFESWLVALMFFQNAFDFKHIASIFGIRDKLVGRCVKVWAPAFRECGYHMARHTLTKEFLDRTYPQSYKDLGFTEPVATIIDGTDVLMETVRAVRQINVMQSSNKVKRSAARGLAWSTPWGGVHEFSDPIFARPSEKAIVKLWAGHGRLQDLPVGYIVSADKGFDGTSGCYHNFNPVIHPAFLTGGNGAQFTEVQIDWNRKACELRYTSEVVFSRFKRHGGLGGIVPRYQFRYLRDMWAWSMGMANFYSCLQVPADNDYFPESKYTRETE
ncbi:hypothetical protein THAOC_36944 [Thalassiosira oceanica]|uniref:Uncharacterized protein n=1 Tax=Thalassiosira oceanica TaxID=159749 RepID=K0QYW0_THAOC|nr:hypothetical protein THAOC_36944 [Thalassiosira oceanica]|eukprot:EJK44508.1 hypothetical protein THAOC_36944 [Thalassiosira oceanica]